MEFTNGAELNKFLSPQILEEVQNDNTGFMAFINDAPPEVVGTDGIHFNKMSGEVTTETNFSGTFTLDELAIEKGFKAWDYIDTRPTKITASSVVGLPFDKENADRKKHEKALMRGNRDYALYQLAPTTSSEPNSIILTTTGDFDSTGRRRLTYADLIELKKQIELTDWDTSPGNLTLVLCPEHKADLLLDKENQQAFNQAFYNQGTGKLNMWLGLNFSENNSSIYYELVLGQIQIRPLGSIILSADVRASILIYTPDTCKYINEVEVFFKPRNLDTTNGDPQSEFRIRNYLMVDRLLNYGGAIVSGVL